MATNGWLELQKRGAKKNATVETMMESYCSRIGRQIKIYYT